MVSIEQIKAGRALINWAQQDLADQTGLSKTAIANVESGKHRPTEKNMNNILDAFDRNGVEFIDGGVRQKQNLIRVLEGDDCYLKLLDEVFHTLKDSDEEFLILCADDRVSPKMVNDSYRRIRDSGIKMRQIVEDGNTYLMAPLAEYRYIPKEYFMNNVTIIYKNNIATALEGDNKISVIKDKTLADTQRKLFNFIWNNTEQPLFTDAKERF